MDTLPDYLRPGLDIIFVGHNPSVYSAQVGHYFATPRNRFWRAINQSGLFPEPLGPETDHRAVEFGVGFTDVVKRPSQGTADVTAQDYQRWAPVLKEKLEHYQPLIVCFHGLTAYNAYLRYAEGVTDKAQLGPQPRSIGVSRVFVVPNPSPANAQFSLEDLAGWYRRLKEFRDSLRRAA